MPNDRHSALPPHVWRASCALRSALRTPHSALRTLRSAFCTRAFTLIEMLTVIAIIGILAAILIPTVRIVMDKARRATASADVAKLSEAATAYNLDFGAFPPDSTAFWSLQDNPFPGVWNGQAPLNPNELLIWYLTRQYSTGSPAAGYPAGWSVPPAGDAAGDWTPSTAGTVFSRGINAGPYFDMKAKQKTDLNANGFYEFVDPWGRPYMYRAYPQSAGASVAAVSGNAVTLTLGNLAPGGTYAANFFCTNAGLANTTGSIQLSGFTSNYAFNGTYTFQGVAGNQVKVTTSNLPSVGDSSGQYIFPLHNTQTCDIYSLGPYGRTRAASTPQNSSNASQEWKPTHGGGGLTDTTSLDAWRQVWGTPGDGNDISSTNGNILINSLYQDNITNWN